mgnify:FL=1
MAAAIASWLHGETCYTRSSDGRIRFDIQTLGGRLADDFLPQADGACRDVYLTGPATKVFETDIDLDRLTH